MEEITNTQPGGKDTQPTEGQTNHSLPNDSTKSDIHVWVWMGAVIAATVITTLIVLLC